MLHSQEMRLRRKPLVSYAQQAAPFFLVIGASMLFEFATPSGYVIRVKLSVFLLAAIFALFPI